MVDRLIVALHVVGLLVGSVYALLILAVTVMNYADKTGRSGLKIRAGAWALLIGSWVIVYTTWPTVWGE